MRRLLIALAMVAALTLGPAATASAQGGGAGGGQQIGQIGQECFALQEVPGPPVACIAILFGLVRPA